eukprot:754217-Hanusia_phi.AAC.4
MAVLYPLRPRGRKWPGSGRKHPASSGCKECRSQGVQVWLWTRRGLRESFPVAPVLPLEAFRWVSITQISGVRWGWGGVSGAGEADSGSLIRIVTCISSCQFATLDVRSDHPSPIAT